MRGRFGPLSCTCTRVSMLVCAHVHPCACACAHICMHRDAHVYVYEHACACVCMRARTRICACKRQHLLTLLLLPNDPPCCCCCCCIPLCCPVLSKPAFSLAVRSSLPLSVHATKAIIFAQCELREAFVFYFLRAHDTPRGLKYVSVPR
jgi:hypothetical protein